MALVCLLPIGMGLLGFGDSASAAEPQDITVTLHKKKMDEFPDGGIKNTGELIQEFEDNYDPLPGVEFTVYDVTEDFYRMLILTGNETPKQYEEKAEALLKTFQLSDVTNPDSKIKGQDVTDTDGKVVFDKLPDRDADGTYKVYLFQETANPDNEQFGQPVVLMLPAKKANTETPNHDIHLYPKNRLENEPTKEVMEDDKTTPLPPEDRYSFDVGKPIYYRASFMIPNQIGEIIKDADNNEIQTRYSKLIFKDEIDKDGVKFGGIEKVTIGGTEVALNEFAKAIYADLTQTNKDPGYLPTGQKAGFEIKFKFNEAKKGSSQNSDFEESRMVAKHLERWRGKKVEILYSVILTDDTEVDVDIKNNFYVDLKNKENDEKKTIPDDELPVVTTGGKKFKKHEKDHENQALKGAEFVVTRKDPSDPNKKQYLKEGANKREWVAVATDYPNAHKITSNEQGLFEITGLEYGDYELVEVKAPNGFQKLDQPFEFEITKDSYAGSDALLGGMVANTSRGGFLPSTGGIGIVIFLLIGGTLMAFAVNRYRKTQHAA